METEKKENAEETSAKAAAESPAAPGGGSKPAGETARKPDSGVPASNPRQRGLVFTQAQNRLATGAISVAAFSVILAFAVALVWAAVKFLSWVSPAVTPLLTAFALSVLFRPFYEFLKKFLRNPMLTFFAMVACVAVPLGFLAANYGGQVLAQAREFGGEIPEYAERLGKSINEIVPDAGQTARSFGAPESLCAFLEDPSSFSRSVELGGMRGTGAPMDVGKWVIGGGRVLFTAALTLLFFVCFITMPQIRGKKLVEYLPMLKESTADFVAEQIDKFFDIVSGFFCRQVAICIFEGCLYGAGFRLIAHLPHGFIIGFMLGALNIVPFFGSVVGLATALPIAFITMGDGGTLCAILVLAVWAAGQMLDAWLITPVVQGGRTKLSYPAIIFSFLFWGTVFNTFLGMLLAIPMSAFCKVLWDSVRRKIRGFI